MFFVAARSALTFEDKILAPPEAEHSEIQPFATFENLGVVGQGVFAEVWKVRSRSDNELYAVKKAKRPFRCVVLHLLNSHEY
jgi:serine/threonine protein kinase